MSRLDAGLPFTLRSMAFVVAWCVGACQTTFEGEAQFPGGPRGCFEACKKQNMLMASFVYVGEYSSACACKPRPSGQAQQFDDARAADADADESQAAIVAAAVGVETQRRREEQARAQAFAPRWTGSPR